MRFVYLFAALASTALVSAVAIPEPQDPASPIIPCGCTNDCIIGCAGKSDCFCPQYCAPTKTTTSVKPTFTCGCTNDCKIACGSKSGCICPQYCGM
ncbi:hypothetical protein ABW21_db0202481 [Orbilia brochopaga]|nr:hypothetical protein ABW21_db0202481 [Drechslerella brochopaga]